MSVKRAPIASGLVHVLVPHASSMLWYYRCSSGSLSYVEDVRGKVSNPACTFCGAKLS